MMRSLVPSFGLLLVSQSFGLALPVSLSFGCCRLIGLVCVVSLVLAFLTLWLLPARWVRAVRGVTKIASPVAVAVRGEREGRRV